VTKEMTVPESGQKFTVEFKVTDMCGDTAKGSLVVNVDYFLKVKHIFHDL